VSLRRVAGVYARGKGRINPVEAQALVAEAVQRLLDPTFGGAGKTLGIVNRSPAIPLYCAGWTAGDVWTGKPVVIALVP